MPNKTIYVPDEYLDVFKKAQEIAGESLSTVIAKALKKYVIDAELQEKQMKEYILWDGEINYEPQGSYAEGKHVKFIGKLLATENVEDFEDKIRYDLYMTLKGNFLLYKVHLKIDNRFPVLNHPLVK